MTEIKLPRMETIKTTAELFNLPVHFVRQKVNSGEVVAVRAGRKYLVNVEKFAEFLNGEGSAGAAENNSSRSTESDKPRIAPIPLR